MPEDCMLLDRKDAGEKLARKLKASGPFMHGIVLALPRGGVPVGFEIAKCLRLPLDIFLVRKLGVPGQEELAMGAIASGHVRVLNRDVLKHVPHSRQALAQAEQREQLELDRRDRLYREGRPFPRLKGRDVILVDDGLATGATMRAALQGLRVHHPRRVIVAVAVAATDALQQLYKADEVACLMTPEPFFSVGYWYEKFGQTSDAEVSALLRASQDQYPQEAA